MALAPLSRFARAGRRSGFNGLAGDAPPATMPSDSGADHTAYNAWRALGLQIFQLRSSGQSVPAELQSAFRDAVTAYGTAAYHPVQHAAGGLNFLDDGTVIDMYYGLPTGQVLTAAQMDAILAGQTVDVPVAAVTAVSVGHDAVGTPVGPAITLVPVSQADTTYGSAPFINGGTAPPQSGGGGGGESGSTSSTGNVVSSPHPSDQMQQANPGLSIPPVAAPMTMDTNATAAPSSGSVLSSLSPMAIVAGLGILAVVFGGKRGRRS